MVDRKELKRRAKIQLGGSIFSRKWLLALVACLIFDIVLSVANVPSLFGSLTQFRQIFEGFESGEFNITSTAFSPFSGFGAVIIIVISGPFAYAIARMFLKQARDGQEMKIEDVFKGFTDDLGGNIVLGLLISIFTALWSMLFIIPGIVKGLSYSMAFYIKSDHPEYDWKACIKESQRIMAGNKGKLFVLQLSFIGWYIVGALCFGVGTLWVVPYQAAAEANFYQTIAYPQIGYAGGVGPEAEF